MPPRDNVPNMPNVSEESFFNRNLRIPGNIQAHRGGVGTSGASQFIKLEGEVPVTFYDYLLDSGMFKYVERPLQHLYKDYGQMMDPEGFPSMDPPSSPHHGATDEPAGQPLRIMEFPTCHYAKDFLEAFSSEHIWNLQNRGDYLRPGVSFQLSLGSQHYTVAISIPYLGVEGKIRPPARNTQKLSKALGSDGLSLEILKRLDGLTDFRESRRLSWPRESSTLTQDRYLNVDNLQGNSVDEHFILVHRAGIVLLNTGASGRDDDDGKRMVDKETLAIFRSCDDKNSGRVPLLPHQRSTNGLDAFLNILSNTLKSSERAVLESLRSKASNYSSDFRRFARGSGAPKDLGGRLISDSATLSGELSAVIDVAKSQKRYIKDLQEFLARLGPGPNHPNGLLRLFGQSPEQRTMLSAKIHFLLEERQEFLDEVNETFLEVKAIEKSFYQLSTLKTSQDIAQRLGEVVTATDGIKSAADGIKSATDGIKSATDDIKSATDGIKSLATGIGSASDSISSSIRRLRKEIVVEMQRQGKRFRRAWWRRIIPSREKAPPPPSD